MTSEGVELALTVDAGTNVQCSPDRDLVVVVVVLLLLLLLLFH